MITFVCFLEAMQDVGRESITRSSEICANGEIQYQSRTSTSQYILLHFQQGFITGVVDENAILAKQGGGTDKCSLIE